MNGIVFLLYLQVVTPLPETIVGFTQGVMDGLLSVQNRHKERLGQSFHFRVGRIEQHQAELGCQCCHELAERRHHRIMCSIGVPQ